MRFSPYVSVTCGFVVGSLITFFARIDVRTFSWVATQILFLLVVLGFVRIISEIMKKRIRR